jgi:FtsP/CotA-like multicopper oxidase with cupredoxin domain
VANQLFYNAPVGGITTPNGLIAATTPTVFVPGDLRVGGVPDPRQIGPQMIQIGTEGGFLPSPIVLANNCIDWDRDPKSMTVGNVRNFALTQINPANPRQMLVYPHTGNNLLLGPAERADVIIDFSQVPTGSTLILYNDAPAAFPAPDPRYDYYTFNPDYSATGLDMGGAPSTNPGKGPNIRTVMQIKVVGSAGAGVGLTALNTAISNYWTSNMDPKLVANGVYAPINLLAGQKFANLPVFNKSISEEFDPLWGLMNALLGTEQANTNNQGQQTWGFQFTDPITEKFDPFQTFNPAGPVDPTKAYQAQVWKITQNGVDTHPIHFHLFNVQVVNRVDWAGVIKPPDANEMGWKDTVRMNPLEDIIIAMKPKVSTNQPFKLPNSKRLLAPTMPAGVTNASFWTALPAGAVAPAFPFTNLATGVTANNTVNFEWEYVWHCHILGHEEHDMMRPIAFKVSPTLPRWRTVTTPNLFYPNKKNLSWWNDEKVQTGFTFTIQRATNTAFTQGLATYTVNSGGSNLASYSLNNTLPARGTYFFRVRAENALGYSDWANAITVRW